MIATPTPKHGDARAALDLALGADGTAPPTGWTRYELHVREELRRILAQQTQHQRILAPCLCQPSTTVTCQPQRRDKSHKGGGLLLPRGIVQKEAGEGRTPNFKHAHQRTFREMFPEDQTVR